MSEEERMTVVRSLQNVFYTNETHQFPSLDAPSGIMRNLPLQRVPWIELPGRSNLVTIQEPQYTHMFEQLLRSNEPWYFGHLYLTGSTREENALRHFPLVTWKDDAPLGSAQVGCLMRIRDYRRLEHGGLVLYVQAMERFVVDTVVQSLPYSVAHVQILPDTSTSLIVNGDLDESSASRIRAKQVQTSFSFEKYEFADTKLPFPQSEYMDDNTEVGMDVMKLLSFSSYSQDENLLQNAMKECESNDDDDEEDSLSLLHHHDDTDNDEASLERRLLDRDILKGEPSKVNKSADEFERLIWLALEEYSKNIQIPLPEQVLCLKPPELKHLELTDAVHPISPDYPRERRQHRLSYTAAGCLNIHLWQDLLELPSTQERLETVLLQLYQRQDAAEGKFQ